MLVGKRCIFEALIGIGKDPYLIGYKPSLHPEGARAPFLWLVRFNLSRASWRWGDKSRDKVGTSSKGPLAFT